MSDPLSCLRKSYLCRSRQVSTRRTHINVSTKAQVNLISLCRRCSVRSRRPVCGNTTELGAWVSNRGVNHDSCETDQHNQSRDEYRDSVPKQCRGPLSRPCGSGELSCPVHHKKQITSCCNKRFVPQNSGMLLSKQAQIWCVVENRWNLKSGPFNIRRPRATAH
jgi:hypothetical protein